ncbi:MAG: O-antigen ligase family protein [Candidatus Eisenbacteria bacterium]|uniref:O-antigen ligase family protein n=1 Tax=Eiseniibacteriota bacterium TaxID=2212470 RepID=A0A948RZI2_UNCEI|nr:O-antigen ligase family protein [Candidatus Eisenbacteria bacterium]MBU1949984.1 O-antigen ligase family protein [Candidatus Eisenbacteria bacterium]MBU2691099.1 O-antigen ligase family protein [Candidatus Eisenbacteria bacterium]
MASSSASFAPPTRIKAEPLLLLCFLILADLVILGAAAVLQVKGLLLLLGGLVFLCLARRTEWALAFLLIGYPIISPLARATHMAGPIYHGLRLFAMGLLGIAILFNDKGTLSEFWNGFRRQPIFWATAGILSMFFIGTFYSSAPDYGMFKVMAFGSKSFLFMILLITQGWIWGRDGEAAQGLRRFLSAVWLFLCVIALTAALNLAFNFDDSGGRLRALALNPIWLARFAGLGLLMTPYAAHRLHWPWSVSGIFLLLFGAVMLGTGSRGPAVAVGAAAFSTLVLHWIDNRRKGRSHQNEALLFTSILVVITGLILLPNALKTRFLYAGSSFISYNLSWSMRVFLYQQAFHLVPQAGPFGLGTGGFAAAIVSKDLRLYPHNVFLEIFIENGWLGFLLFGFFLYLIWRMANQLLRHRPEFSPEVHLILMLVVYALVNAMASGDIAFNEEIYIWAGLLGALKTATSIGPQPKSGEPPPSKLLIGGR